jgi:hypothetical protein
MKRALLLLALTGLSLAQSETEITGNPEIYEGLVLGIGPGTLAVVVAMIIAMIMCLFKDSIEAPNVCVAAAIALPLIVLGIVRGLPVRSLKTD